MPDDATQITVTIPGLPPSVNHLYPAVRGRRYRSPAATEWHLVVADACIAARLRPVPSKRSVFSMSFFFKGMGYNRDVDGAIKVTEDALAAALAFDDRWVDTIIASRVAGEVKETVVILDLRVFSAQEIEKQRTETARRLARHLSRREIVRR
jgi:Holliday junction resolvase RusA-like endonuclease